MKSPLRVSSEENTNVYVGNLTSDIQEEDLRPLFSPFGDILEIIKKGERYGFIRFSSQTEAEKAIEALNSTTFRDRKLTVSWGSAAHYQQNGLHLKFNVIPYEDCRKLLHSELKRFGKVVRLEIPVTPAGEVKGFAFAFFEEDEAGFKAAASAVRKLHKTKIGDLKLHCSFAQDRLKNRSRGSEETVEPATKVFFPPPTQPVMIPTVWHPVQMWDPESGSPVLYYYPMPPEGFSPG